MEEKYLASLNLENEGDDIDFENDGGRVVCLVWKTIDETPDKM